MMQIFIPILPRLVPASRKLVPVLPKLRVLVSVLKVLMVVHCLLQTTDDINILMEDGKTIKAFMLSLAKPQ